MIVPQHGAFDLAGVDSFFDQDFPVVLRRQIQCGCQLAPVMNFTDSHRRAKVHRLYKQGIAQFPFDSLADYDGMFFPVRAEDEFPGNDGKVRVAKQALHHVFIHACRRGKHARTYVGNISQFQEPLDRAVFSKRSVKDRKDDIDLWP